MKTLAVIFVALGILTVPLSASSIKQKTKSKIAGTPDLPNQFINMRRYEKIRNKTHQWKPFKPEENPFSSYSDDQLRGLLGLDYDPEEEAKKAGGEVEEDAALAQSLPTGFDSRTKWSNCVGAVRNQGSCGSCWAFSSVGALQDRYCIASNGRVDKQLSPQYLVSCDRYQSACYGGNMRRAWQYLTSPGTVEDNCSPYQSANKFVPSCPSRCSNGAAMKKYTCASGSVVVKYGSAAIKAELMANGPMDTAFTVYRDFYNYRSGIYRQTSSWRVGGHAVKLIGWGKEGNVEYWIIQNSWGPYWGEKGFFRIQVGSCGIAREAWGCRPNLTGF